MTMRLDPAGVNTLPRTTGPGLRPTPAPAAPVPAAPARPGVPTTFEPQRPRADGGLLLGRRDGGPGEVSLSKKGELLLNGRAGAGAKVEAARLIEVGFDPFKHATPTQRTALAKELAGTMAAPEGGKKQTTQGPLLNRSAAATLLLSLARTAPDKATREATLNTYVKALSTEPNLSLRKSMMLNLDFAKLKLPTTAEAKLEKARAELAPPKPPYDEWFKGQAKPKLEIKHYVMDEFWKEEVRNWKARGFEVTKDGEKSMELRGIIKDPTGQNPPIAAHVVLKQDDTNVLRDIDDPTTQMIIYSGHSQLGGIMDASIAAAPKEMKGAKMIELFNCRGKQNAPDLLAKYPGAHVTNTFSSAYGSDDKLVLDAQLASIGARGDYDDVKKRLDGGQMLQPESNYMLPNDKRNLSARDDDRDGLTDLSALGPDRFFDPGRAMTRGGQHVFSPGAIDDDPQQISGAKLDHALGYANTTFFYYAEANKRAPLTVAQSDKMLSGGWFVGNADEKVRIKEVKKDGVTYQQVSVNSKLAGRSREVIASTVLMEMQKHLAIKDHGAFTEKDKLAGAILVGGYLDLFVPYSDTINEVLDGFSKTYGFTGLTYDVYYEAAKKDGHDGTASAPALNYLKQHGVSVRAPA